MDGLRANMLIGNDIIGPEQISINVAERTALIVSCGVCIPISARQRLQPLRKKVLNAEAMTLPPRTETFVPVLPTGLPDDRDFFFQPLTQAYLTLFSHLVDHTTGGVLVRNESQRTVRLPRKQKLGLVTEVFYENCFQAGLDLDTTEMPPKANPLHESRQGIRVSAVDPSLETKLPNGVRVYGDRVAVEKLSSLVAEFASIWEMSGFVNVPPERWMTVPLRDDWQSRVSSIKPRVYPLGNESKKLVDNTFDKLQRQGRLVYTQTHTPFSFPVFVVWKPGPNGSRKGRAVVDIRKLNDLVVSDSYPLPLQSEIIANVQGCTHLAVLDTASLFYQWLLYPDHCFMFTVVTHRGQETFQVPIMGYVNSEAYVQREIDNILRSVRDWARAYVDDIICGAKSLDDLLVKLRTLFEIFVAYNISIQPTKLFLNYPDVGLLGQRVDSLGLTTAEDKLQAIKLLSYPDTLEALEYYLGLTGYLRSYIHFYVQLAEPLQALKTSLLKSAPVAGQQRRAYASKTKLSTPTPRELASFHGLQAALAQLTTLAHHDPNKTLWIDLDASKEFGFGAVLFHARTDEVLPEGKWPPRSAICPIIFLSRLLTQAKKNYWPTELEIAGFM